MAHKLSDRGRRPINLKNRTVKEAVPEYFTSENPTLISFLEKYYQFMDTSDGTHDLQILGLLSEDLVIITEIKVVGFQLKNFLEHSFNKT